MIHNELIKNAAALLAVLMMTMVITSCTRNRDLGVFEGKGDIGPVRHAGAVQYDPVLKTYTTSGSGTNMWFKSDELHYVWKQMSDDVSLAADIQWLGQGVEPHRKACLIFRQSLAPDASYADVAVHGDGLTSLQYRESAGENTREVQVNVTAPKRVRIEKEGDYLHLSVSSADGQLTSTGASCKLPFVEPFYVGLGVCAHNPDVIETAVFSKVIVETVIPKPDSLKKISSTLETIPITSFDRRVVYHTDSHIEAPNWSPDGKTLIYNSNGLLYKIPIQGGVPEQIPTGLATKINNDHGISPDGKQLVISDQTETGNSLIYLLPIDGGNPRKITPRGPSYWHGWSPDGQTLVYCAERNGNYDVYAIPVTGGEEKRLTTAEGLDDGPEYSPDGKYIYFNSVRSGTMKIWRMKADASEQEQITTDQYNDWFAHPSPDGKWIVYITYISEVPVGSHPPNKEVMLRLMNLETREVQVMAKLFGGQGTINVPSWSPDSQRIAFVSYSLR